MEIILESDENIAAESMTESKQMVGAAILWMEENTVELTPDQQFALIGLKKAFGKM